MSRTLQSLRANRRVEFCDDERSLGNGVILTLRQGWSWEPMQDSRVRGFDTLSQAMHAAGHEAIIFAGPYTQ